MFLREKGCNKMIVANEVAKKKEITKMKYVSPFNDVKYNLPRSVGDVK